MKRPYIETIIALIASVVCTRAENLQFSDITIDGQRIIPGITTFNENLHCSEIGIYDALVSNDTLYIVSDKWMLFNNPINCMRLSDMDYYIFNKYGMCKGFEDMSTYSAMKKINHSSPIREILTNGHIPTNCLLYYGEKGNYGELTYASIVASPDDENNGNAFEYGPLKANAKWHDIEDALMWNGLKPAEVKTVVIIYPTLVNDPWWSKIIDIIPRQSDNLFDIIVINLSEGDEIQSFRLTTVYDSKIAGDEVLQAEDFPAIKPNYKRQSPY